jgi:hypothetical protein
MPGQYSSHWRSRPCALLPDALAQQTFTLDVSAERLSSSARNSAPAFRQHEGDRGDRRSLPFIPKRKRADRCDLAISQNPPNVWRNYNCQQHS